MTTIGELAYGFVVHPDNPARDLPGFVASFTVVPYRDASQVMQDLLAGRPDCPMTHMPTLAPQLRDRRVHLLAFSSEARLAGFPEVATFAEQGFPAITTSEAFSVMLPARAPEPMVGALHSAIAVAEPGLRERLGRLELTPMVLSSQATVLRLRAELAAWGPVVAASGFKAEE